ncbi:MAG: cellulase family glycosylhydrolase [Ferruginibacter sp.]
MLHRIILSYFISFICLSVSAQNFYHTKGQTIIDPAGKTFQMKGTNLGNWLVPEGYMFKFKNTNSPAMINQLLLQLVGPDEAATFWKKFLDNYITSEDINYLKSIGVNSIRAPFNYRLFTDEYYMGDNNPEHGFKYLDSLVKWCKVANMPILLDMHSAPGGQTGDNIDDSFGYPYLFESATQQQRCIDIWQRIAKHYANEPIIIGYDLLNEPIATYFDKTILNPHLEPLYKKITSAIRAVDTHHILFFGGAQWNGNFSVFGAPFDNNAVYTFHKYWMPTTQEHIQEYINFSNKYNVPIYCGETGENDDDWIMRFRKLLDSNHISWHFWPYKKMESTRGFLQFAAPAAYDSIIAYSEAPRLTYADIRKYRPTNIVEVKQALDGVLENCLFKNCSFNNGYIKALGFVPKKH